MKGLKKVIIALIVFLLMGGLIHLIYLGAKAGAGS